MNPKNNILIVDDDPHLRKTLSDILKNKGYRTTTAVTGKLALKKIQEETHAVALIDLKLEDMSGLELMAAIKRYAPAIECIVLTGYASQSSAIEAVNLGAYSYVQKPYDMEYLLVTIRRAIEKQRMEEELEQYRQHLEQLVEKRTTELSKANAELTHAARLKDEFLAMMSHELRTPLNVILGMSEVLQTGVYGTLNDRQIRASRMIEESGRHLLEIITDILELSEMRTRRMKLDIGPVAIESICQTSLRLIGQSARKKKLKVSFTIDNAITTIYADGRYLRRVLVNLLNNAVKFSPEGGRIGLKVESDPEHHMVYFTVWDTGIGIAKEDMERLFQPFVQLDSTLSRKYEGIGLGLTLVYRIADIHGGSISVESEVGKGSRFTVSLPWGKISPPGPSLEGNNVPIPPSRGESTGPTLHSRQSTIDNQQSITVLIAEDNEFNIETFSNYLQAKGYRVMTARNGEEAIERAQENQPDIILIDLHMPVMGGLEAIRHFRMAHNLKTIPIIAITALVIPGGREKCLAVGADEYFSKPVSLQKLSEVFEKLLTKKR